jgi:hypothetical protein
MTQVFKFITLLIATLLISISVSAQETAKIPADLLQVDHQRCMRSCVPGFGEMACKPLCDCTVKEFDKRIDFERYLDLAAELARNEIGPESRKLLDDIALYCADQVEKSGVEIGSGAAGDPSGKTPQ